MPPRNYPPAYLRFLKARLWNLGRPSIWGTALFLFVVGLGVWEYWSHPKTFTSKQDTPAVSNKPVESSSSLSQEEKAVIADIDNLPVLLNDFEQATLSVVPITPNDKTQTSSGSESLEDIINKQNAAASEAKSKLDKELANNVPAPTVKNPFVVQAENLLQSGTGDAGSLLLDVKSLTVAPEPTTEATTFSNLGMGLTNKTKQNQSPVLVNPLQAALNQSTNQKPSSFNNATTTPINPLGQNASGGSIMMPPSQSLPPTTGTSYIQPTVTNQPQNPYSNYNGGQTLPIAGTSTTGVSPVTPAASYPAQPATQSITNSTTPLGYANYGNPDFQQPNQLPPSTYSNPNFQQPNQLPQSNGSYSRQLGGRYNR